MRLYCTPGGTWAGNEADYKKALKAEGVDAKTVDRKQVEVPTAKPELLEFLTFHGVNPIGRRGPQVVGGVTLPPPAPPAAPQTDADRPAGAGSDDVPFDLDAAFDEAPIGDQLRLAMFAINKAKAKLVGA